MLFLYFYLISFSMIGYGLLLSKILKIKLYNFGYLGFLGISVLITVSYFSSLFIPHSYIFNTVIIMFGIIAFILFYRVIPKIHKEFFNHFLIFSFLSIFILVSKNHDDFSYYHFAYTQLITEYSHPIGMGNLNNGFRHPSSLFFLNSMFYLPKISFYLFHTGPAFILGFANLFLLKNILDKDIFKKLSFISLLSLIFFIFINIFFYRLAEHGTDRSGLIIAICLIILLLMIVNSKYDTFNSESSIKFFSIFLCLLISIKPFYLIYAPFFLILLLNDNTKKIIIKLLFSRTFFYCLSFVFFVFFYTFINSGCIIFPLEFTCFDSLYWSTSNETVKGVRIWYELWAKGGANPHFIVEDKIAHISGFNWLSNWIDTYFFNKVSDFLLGLTVLLIIFFLTFYLKFKNIELNKNHKIKFLPVYILLLFCFGEWFMHHPSLRYGGYHLLPLIIYIPLCLYLSNLNFSREDYIKRALILITITALVFLTRNGFRLFKEYKQYQYNPLISTNYKIDYDLLFQINKNVKINIINENGLSKYKKIKILGRDFVIIKD